MHENSESQQGNSKASHGLVTKSKSFKQSWDQFLIENYTIVATGLAFLSIGEENIPLLDYIKLGDPNSLQLWRQVIVW